jgi:hypothetical protein
MIAAWFPLAIAISKSGSEVAGSPNGSTAPATLFTNVAATLERVIVWYKATDG